MVFLRHALPGERVLAVVTEARHASYLRADALEVLADASADRVPAPCPHARPGGCGGCDWQHAALPAQRRDKADLVRGHLSRVPGRPEALLHGLAVEELPGAPDGLGWRTRAQFAVDGSGRPGLRRSRSHDVEPLEHCPLVTTAVAASGVLARRWPAAGSVEVVAGSSGPPAVTTTEPTRSRSRAGRPQRVRGPAHVPEQAAGRSWLVPAAAFWQVHPAAADVLSAAVLDALAPRPGECVVDLYCGVGLFAGALAPAVGPSGSVLGVESSAAAVSAGTAALADLPQVRLERAAVTAELVGRLAPVDLVVLDPPRAGAGADVSAALVSSGARAVAYVSCEPSTLARDLVVFLAHGWELSGLRAFDLFPMTAHVECLAVLTPPDRPTGEVR